MANNKKKTYFKLIMSEISENSKNLFWPQKPPILKVEIRFYSDRKCFSQIFENWPFFFHLNFISIKKKSEPFLIGPVVVRSLTHYHRFAVAVWRGAS